MRVLCVVAGGGQKSALAPNFNLSGYFFLWEKFISKIQNLKLKVFYFGGMDRIEISIIVNFLCRKFAAVHRKKMQLPPLNFLTHNTAAYDVFNESYRE